MQDNMPCKKITLDKPEGRRRAGKPNLRWMDGVMRDEEKLGIRNWRTKTRDRDGWRRLLESAKTLHGLQRLGVSHGVQSASMNLRKFHFLDYSRMFKKWVLRMTRNSYFPLVLIFMNSGQVQYTTGLYFFRSYLLFVFHKPVSGISKAKQAQDVGICMYVEVLQDYVILSSDKLRRSLY